MNSPQDQKFNLQVIKTGTFFKPSVIKRNLSLLLDFRRYDLCTVRIAHKDHGILHALLRPCKKERYTLVATCFHIIRVCQRITISSSRQGTKGSSLSR